MSQNHWNKGILKESVKHILRNWDSPEKFQDSVWLQSCIVKSYPWSKSPGRKVLALRRVIEDTLSILGDEDAERKELIAKFYFEDYTMNEMKQEFRHYTKDQINSRLRGGVNRLQQILEELEESCQLDHDLESIVSSGKLNLGIKRSNIAQHISPYLAALLESDDVFEFIPGQILVQGIPTHSPISEIVNSLRRPRGPKILFISCSGGMGKTTLASRLVQILSYEDDIDFIVGTSAKTKVVNIDSNNIELISPTFRNPQEFYTNLCQQLAIPKTGNPRQMVREISKLGKDHRILIFIDNLDTLNSSEITKLVSLLQPLLSREVHAIVTCRHADIVADSILSIELRPLLSIPMIRRFIDWHGVSFCVCGKLWDYFGEQHYERLIEVSGGNPLIIQILISQLQYHAWDYLDRFHECSEYELFDYLYQSVWDNLDDLGDKGVIAKKVAKYIALSQNNNNNSNFDTIQREFQDVDKKVLDAALIELQKRYLIQLRGGDQSSYVTFPSFIAFIGGMNE